MSDSTIVTKSAEKTDREGNIIKAYREIELEKPAILIVDNVAGLVEVMGEEAIVKAVTAQITVSFRSHIRVKLDSMTDGEFNHTDADIEEIDFTDWKPESRTRKSAEEKAAELMGKLTPEQIQAVLAQLPG